MNKLGIEHCLADFSAANFRCEEEFLQRFVASLIAKRFVILTGMSGSGKTKLAQAFVRWISSPQFAVDPFERGAQIGNSYRVMDSDRISVEFWNKKNEKVVLPRLGSFFDTGTQGVARGWVVSPRWGLGRGRK